MDQLASFHVSAQRMSIDFVQMMTIISSIPSLQILVHKQGPAEGVIPVFIPLIPLWPNIKWVLYHLYVLLFPLVFFFTL